jgi:hypothetical protein
MYFQTNGFLLLEKVSKSVFELPKHLANDKHNLEKIGFYRISDPFVLIDYGLYKVTNESLIEEYARMNKYDFYAFVDNFQINEIQDDKTTLILAPKSCIMLLKLVKKSEVNAED